MALPKGEGEKDMKENINLIGKTIECRGARVVIKEVYSAECWDGKWDIEFRDTNGKYRRWKQEFDGGYLE